MHTINLQASRINIISQLLKYKGTYNTITPLFKKTAIAFKRKYGFDIIGAPIVFKSNGFIYKLSFMQDRHSKRCGGRRWEQAEYLPYVEVGDKFEHLNIK